MSKSFGFFAILALVVAVQLIQVEGVCTRIVADCTAKNLSCPAVCKAVGSGAKLIGTNCDFYNLCTCTYDHEPYDIALCDIGMGLCTKDCRSDCCDAKCTGQYPKSGVGLCIHHFGLDYCRCTYRRP
ncbi:Defensin fusion [Medicago truncatula]|uniref:Defensin-like protein n=1 Tax=Medicago truncatula TaxID=3880 RepID=G7ING8_MEDTR|nr:Defensin fusion [Medicago truncatula]